MSKKEKKNEKNKKVYPKGEAGIDSEYSAHNFDWYQRAATLHMDLRGEPNGMWDGPYLIAVPEDAQAG